MKKYISIILSAIIALSPVYCLANEAAANEENIIICANPADYDEMTGIWNIGGLQTKFQAGNGDYPTKSSFKNEEGGTTYSVDLGNKAGFYKTVEDGSSFYAGVWVRLRSFNTGGNFNVYSVESDSAHHRAFLWYNKANEITLSYYNGDKVCAETRLTHEYANRWVYLGFAREVGTEQTVCTIYVNGAAVASGTSTSLNTGEATLSIATAISPQYYGSESLGEVEILSHIPDEEEILKKYTDNAAKYRAAEQNGKIFSLNMTGEGMTDTAGGAAIEKSGGADAGAHAYPYGITEPALVLPEEGYVKAESESLISGNDMTWELWLSADTKETGTIFAMGGDINNPEAHAVLQDGKVIFRAGRYDDETYVSSTVCEIEANKLYHLVFTRSYFESDGKGFFRYSAYCNSERIAGFPLLRCGAAPAGQKTPMYIGSGISADILDFNVYNEVIAQDNILKMYYKTARPTNVSPAAGEENLSVNKDCIELEYEFPVTEEMLELQNITAKKNGQLVETVNTAQDNKIICSIVNGLEYETVYLVYSGAKMLTEFKTRAAGECVRYSYDFENEANDPNVNLVLSEGANAAVTFKTNPKTGSRAMKFTEEYTSKKVTFAIDLPEAVDTRYVLVKMEVTPTEGTRLKSDGVNYDTVVHMPDGPILFSSDSKESMRFGYRSSYPSIYYGDSDNDGKNENSNLFSAISKTTVAAQRTDNFEALLDLTNDTVTFYEDQSQHKEMTMPIISTEANDVKTLQFKAMGYQDATIYYDNIEVIGANSLSAFMPSSATPANGAKDVSININEITLEYPMRLYTEYAASQTIAVTKNGEALTKDTDYTVTTSGNKMTIALTEVIGVDAQMAVSVNGTNVTSFTAAGNDYTVKYSYDFEDAAKDPNVNLVLATGANAAVTFETNPVTGSRAMKFTEKYTNKNAAFAIELPEAVGTRYVLVKMEATPTEGDRNGTLVVHTQDGPSLLSSDGEESISLKYGSSWPRIDYGDGSGGRKTGNLFSAVNASTIAAQRTDSFEALLDLTNKTVTYYDAHSKKEMNEAIISAEANDVKTLQFKTVGYQDATIYYDNIEVIGANSLSAFEDPGYTVTGITSEGNAVTALKDAAGKTLNIAIDKTGIFTLIAAVYDDTGALAVAATEADGAIAIAVPQEADANYTTKLFAWQSLTDITPVLETQPVFE